MFSNMKLPSIISDNMVLQRDAPIKIWGWDQPGLQVTVELLGNVAETQVGENGKWQVVFPSMSHVGTTTMRVVGRSEVTIHNILFGDVWLGSGQSNMEWPVKNISQAEEEIRNADYPEIRLFQVTQKAELGPIEDVIGHWEICSPASVENFSAVSYFFGRSLHLHAGIPLGLVMSAWGGTMVEAWMSRSALASEPRLRKALEESEATSPESHQQTLQEWIEEQKIQDPGDSGFGRGWAATDFDDAQWETMEVPGRWQARGLNFCGVLWFRKEVTIPGCWEGKDCILSLGPCDKSDTTWFNNTQVGAMSIDDNEAAWSIPREYRIPAHLVRAGKNTIAVRIYSHVYAGGFTGRKEEMKITCAGAEGASLPLAGDWKYFVEHNFGPSTHRFMPGLPPGAGNPNTRAILYNNMIAPITPFAIKGAIWYQGESNAARSDEYEAAFKLLIASWRESWQANFSFYFVQLANYVANMDTDTCSSWAELREAQAKALELPNTGMAVAIDLGTPEDIHPLNKQDVGERLALIARHQHYGEQVEYSGPAYETVSRNADGDIRISFSHAHGLCTARGEPPRGFSILAKGQSVIDCTAVIDGTSVVIPCPGAEAPFELRYGWKENPDCNLYNGAGLPASPFRAVLG